MDEKVYLTLEGKKQLEEKLNYYRTVKRPDVVKRIGIAREFGDLSENSEYDIAKEEQNQIDIAIGEMEARLRNVVIIDEKKLDTSKVNLGVTVKLHDKEFDEILEYKIVGVTESNPAKGLISYESPVGKGLLGKSVGEVVRIETPQGMIDFEILAISK